jgi:hypothetical protein
MMAIQTKTTTLKLFDDEPKTLGVSGLTATPVRCTGLTEGVDYQVDRVSGTIRRLRAFGRELLVFTCEYEDGAAVRAAELAAANTDRDTARATTANLEAYVYLATPTNAQTVAAVKLLCRVAIILIRQA